MNNDTSEKGHHYTLAPDLTIHRIVNGMWQVAGGHGYIHRESAIEEMMKYRELESRVGILRKFMALRRILLENSDGDYMREKGKEELDKMQALTKWIPSRKYTTYPIVKKNTKITFPDGFDSIDLLQFHWWDYINPYYMDTIQYLSNIRDEGIINHIGLTNFDTKHMQIIMDPVYKSYQTKFNIQLLIVGLK